jgi:hypothetical protein
MEVVLGLILVCAALMIAVPPAAPPSGSGCELCVG